jgi:hypothetical protein
MNRIRWLPALLPGALLTRPALAQLPGQSFEVQAESATVSVGDSVTLRFRMRLDDRDLLFDTVPVPITSPLRGVRVLSVGRLVRDQDRIFLGRARVAFYRPGRQAAPNFAVTFMRAVKGVQRGTLASDTAWVEITPVLPAGDQPLKDIKPLAPAPGSSWAWLVGGALGVVALGWFLRSRRRTSLEPQPGTPPPPRDPLGAALEALDRIEQADWPASGQVRLHYESVSDVLRDYLVFARQIPARELTTSQLLRALPTGNTSTASRRLFGEADLVKFARVRPDPRTAAGYLRAARDALAEWTPIPATGNGHAVR